MNIYWFSFSFRGKNNGVCLIEAKTLESAETIILEKKLVPENDHAICVKIDDLSQEGEFEFNRLYSPEEMRKIGYESTLSKKQI